jgi:hypothetical protein
MLELEVHLREGFLHMLDVLAGIGQPHGPLPQIAAQHAYLVRGAERAGPKAKGVEPLQPLAVMDITLGSPLDFLHLVWIDEQDFEATALQQLKEWEPIDSGRFQRNGGDATRGQPVSHGG